MAARKRSTKVHLFPLFVSPRLSSSVVGSFEGSFENEALENEAPKTRKRSTQNSKTKHAKIENEAPKTRDLSVL